MSETGTVLSRYNPPEVPSFLATKSSHRVFTLRDDGSIRLRQDTQLITATSVVDLQEIIRPLINPGPRESLQFDVLDASNDDLRFVIKVKRQDAETTTSTSSLWWIDLTTKRAINIGTAPRLGKGTTGETGGERNIDSISLSPDGSTVAFTGSGLVCSRQPSKSPDGRKDLHLNIIHIAPDGSQSVTIGDDFCNRSPLAPDAEAGRLPAAKPQVKLSKRGLVVKLPATTPTMPGYRLTVKSSDRRNSIFTRTKLDNTFLVPFRRLRANTKVDVLYQAVFQGRLLSRGLTPKTTAVLSKKCFGTMKKKDGVATCRLRTR